MFSSALPGFIKIFLKEKPQYSRQEIEARFGEFDALPGDARQVARSEFYASLNREDRAIAAEVVSDRFYETCRKFGARLEDFRNGR
jgi:hypothetical protein